MVDLLRDQKRQYSADLRGAIKLSNQAQGWSDVSRVASTLSSISSSIERADLARQKQADQQAQSDLSAHEKEAQSIVADLRNKYGEKITSEKGQQAVRDALGKHFRNYRPEYDNGRTGASYDTGADTYINKVIDENYLYATKAKISRQNAERQAAQTAARQAMRNSANNVAKIGDLYIQQAGELGKYGANKDFRALTTDLDSDVSKALEKVPATPAQRDAMKMSIYDAAVQNHIINALSSEDDAVAEEMDLALHDQEKFDKTFPAEYVAGHIQIAKDQQIRQWENERDRLANAAQTADGGARKDIEKQIKAIDKKITALNDENKIDGQNFDDKVKSDMREGLSEVTKPMVKQRLGERALATRLETYEKQKQVMADGVLNPYDPSLLKMLREKGKNLTVEDLKQYKNLSHYKPEEWREMADAYESYRDKMSDISPLTESFYTTKMDVNAGLFELMSSRPTNDVGDPTEFQFKALKFLDKMASADLTQEERLAYRDYVGQILLSDNDTVQQQREILASGDVGIYAKGGGAGIINYPANDLAPDDTRQGGGISGTRRLRDERGGWGGLNVKSSENGRAQYANSDFEKSLLRANAEYMTNAVRMLKDGASRDDVLLMQKQTYEKAINDYYKDFHVVDLAALDSKLEQHQPAYQNIDGVVYEYKGRDSIGRPLWYDHGVLNTNRDFHQLFMPKTMAGAPTTGVGGTVKRSEIGSDMGAKNE